MTQIARLAPASTNGRGLTDHQVAGNLDQGTQYDNNDVFDWHDVQSHLMRHALFFCSGSRFGSGMTAGATNRKPRSRGASCSGSRIESGMTILRWDDDLALG
ncbi:MAG: hypothetical protein HY525_04150 [Betaproteobacteria bacterium]|nr:hypothetical protein [Betaproteobacteria bacterium]